MITIDQARNNIDAVLQEVRNPPLNRAEHDVLRQSLNVLYAAAKDGEESRQDKPEPTHRSPSYE